MISWAIANFWLIPLLPLAAALLILSLGRSRRTAAFALAVVGQVAAVALAIGAFVGTLQTPGAREVRNFTWFTFGEQTLRLGFVLDPLAAAMLVMITFVGLWIFVFSKGYMAGDKYFTRFFAYLSFFSGAMLGVVIANSLLLLFVSWELVGLASYLLIGFWIHKPSAAAAAKKAFITTRIGDLGFFLGILWLYRDAGTLLFYDGGKGCLEAAGLLAIGSSATFIALLIFSGAVGKSGQFPLHVWLPDAMEGPTPVSALIHAATMVAAGVYLIARVYPLMAAGGTLSQGGAVAGSTTTALTVVTWVGASTAVFAALIAVAQNDIKRILAYSTVSQLGYMMAGLGLGGVAVGMFHLITHAFFKALLFMGAGSVIHGCHEEQDIRHMGGLRKYLPITFATYAVGMMALSGVPLFFSGFWSKDEILHSVSSWPPSRGPFILLALGTLLTAFYMTRQMCYVFFGRYRGHGVYLQAADSSSARLEPVDHSEHAAEPHESPPVMTWPLMILAAGAVLLGFIGTPLWPWFQSFISGEPLEGSGISLPILRIMLFSVILVIAGIGLGWAFYGRRSIDSTQQPDVLEAWNADFFTLLRQRFLVDEFYDATIVRALRKLSVTADLCDRYLWGGVVQLAAWIAL